MTSGALYAVLGIAAVSVGGLAGLVWFAARSGKNAQAVTETAAVDAKAKKTQAMAQAETDKPADEAALLARLDGGAE